MAGELRLIDVSEIIMGQSPPGEMDNFDCIPNPATALWLPCAMRCYPG